MLTCSKHICRQWRFRAEGNRHRIRQLRSHPGPSPRVWPGAQGAYHGAGAGSPGASTALPGGGQQSANSGRGPRGYEQPGHDPRQRLPEEVSTPGVRENRCVGASLSQLLRVKCKIFRNSVRQSLNMAIIKIQSFVN